MHMQETIIILGHEGHDEKYDQYMEEVNINLNVLILPCALSTMIDEGDQFAMSLTTLSWSD